MSTQALKKLNNYWQSRNRRERVLAAAVGVLLLFALGYSLVQGARLRLRQLDAQIRILQDDIVTFNYQVARRQTVERQYSRVAAQHSSAWTAPEVQERLRQEIYRLAKKTPPPLNEEGIPEVTSSDEGNLVEIPGLRGGNLSESEEGDYRQYSISFEVPPVEGASLIAFLERLQNSPQSLRFDALELLRPPDSTQISAKIQLARIIVAGVQGQEAEPSAVEEAQLSLDPAEWTCEGCQLQPGNPGDPIVATSTAPEAQLYTRRALPARASYQLSLEVSASSGGTLGIATGDGTPFSGVAALNQEEGARFRYVVQFTTPGDSGQAQLRLPVLSFSGPGASIQVHAITLGKLTE